MSQLATASAFADRRTEGAMQLEVGVNTRHFAAVPGDDIAFRSSTGDTDSSLPAGEAVTTSIRFTGKARYNTFFGVEGEVGEMIGYSTSNIAGAYGVAGARGELGRLRVAAELVAGRRWVRYEIVGKSDPSVMMMEPRVRADLWLSPRLTLGGAVGATLGDRRVWMAGFYIGLHSADFDRL
jgi:hypothetical protein